MAKKKTNNTEELVKENSDVNNQPKKTPNEIIENKEEFDKLAPDVRDYLIEEYGTKEQKEKYKKVKEAEEFKNKVIDLKTFSSLKESLNKLTPVKLVFFVDNESTEIEVFIRKTKTADALYISKINAVIDEPDFHQDEEQVNELKNFISNIVFADDKGTKLDQNSLDVIVTDYLLLQTIFLHLARTGNMFKKK